MSESHGKFVWYELMTRDVPAAGAFYESVLGWTAKDSGMPGMAYTIFSAGEADVGGMMALPEEARAMGMRPAWMGYVAVDDVDASAGQVIELGGAIHKAASDIPHIGRFAVVADPQGASIMLFKPHEPMTPRPVVAPGTPGHAGWHELYSDDPEAGFAFYHKIFGWTKADAVDMGAMGVYQLFAHNGVPIGGMMKRPEDCPVSVWTYYFNVEDINTTVARIEDSGGKIINKPMQVPGGSWIVQCFDPQGALVSFVAPDKA